jgi:DNA-directed RNA polymerase subunit beta'
MPRSASAAAATAWTCRPVDGRRGHGRRHHRRPVDRRAGHAADDADLPHRRHGVNTDVEESEIKSQEAGQSSSSPNAIRGERGRQEGRPDPQRRDLAAGPKGREIEKYDVPPVRCSWSRRTRRSRPGTCSASGTRTVSRSWPRSAVRSASRTSSRAKTMRWKRPRRVNVRMVIIEHKGDLHPQIVIEDDDGKPLDVYYLPERPTSRSRRGSGSRPARCWPRRRVRSGYAGHHRRSAAGDGDLRGPQAEGPGGHRRDRRRRRNRRKRRGKRTIIVRSESGIEREHLVPHGKRFRCTGDASGPARPWSTARSCRTTSCGSPAKRRCSSTCCTRSRSVYRSQRVEINDKHIEIIVAQMLRKVRGP